MDNHSTGRGRGSARQETPKIIGLLDAPGFTVHQLGPTLVCCDLGHRDPRNFTRLAELLRQTIDAYPDSASILAFIAKTAPTPDKPARSALREVASSIERIAAGSIVLEGTGLAAAARRTMISTMFFIAQQRLAIHADISTAAVDLVRRLPPHAGVTPLALELVMADARAVLSPSPAVVGTK